MGFLKDSSGSQSVYTEVKQEKTLVRPLSKTPTSVWVHKIQQVGTTGPGGQVNVIRKFSQETCTANGRTGAGCSLCNTPDPLWHMLPKDEQTNRNGKRTDFPKSPIHMLPVFNHTSQQVEVLRGGNQLFQDMDKWYDDQNDAGKDLRRCDWSVWKNGTGKMTKYQTSRLDASGFAIDDELVEQAKNVLSQAMADRRPTDPAALLGKIRGDSGDAAAFLGEGTVPVSSLPAGMPVTAGLPTGALTSAGPSYAAPSFGTPAVVAQAVAPVGPEVRAPTGGAASNDLVTEFGTWVSLQPEFSGVGMVHTLMPMLREKVGHVDYYKLSAEQLVDLRTALEAKLAEKRNKKA